MRRTVAFMALFAFALIVCPPSVQAVGATMRVNPTTIVQGERITLTLTGFQEEESISFWLTLPDYRVQAVGDITANRDGSAEKVVLIALDLPVGSYQVSARGNRGGTVLQATFEVQAARGLPASPGVVLAVAQQTRPQGQCFTFSGTGYLPQETIAVWLRMPDGGVTNQGLEDTSADTRGGLRYQVCFSYSAVVGPYTFSAAGKTSQLTGISAFSLTRGDSLGIPNQALLFVEPTLVKQLDAVTLIGGGFTPEEHVSIWITLPNGVVEWLFAGYTLDGTFEKVVTLPVLPVGTHVISAYGETSGLRAVTTLELRPGSGG